MSNKNKGAWKPGQTGNPSGRPRTGGRGTGRPISRLRSTLNKLKELEPDAIEVIGKSLNPDVDEDGRDIPVPKDKLDTAKWIVSSLNTLTRGAIAEESYRLDVRDRKESEESDRATGTEGKAKKPRLSLRIVEDE